MPKSTLRASALLLLLSLVPQIHASETGAGDKSARHITICVPYFREEFLTLAVLTSKDHGFFADNGLSVEILAVKNTAPASPASLRKGELPPNLLNDFNVASRLSEDTPPCQFGASNIERFLTRADHAQDRTQPLLLSSYGADYDTHLIVAADSKIKTVADLRGKRVRLGQAPVRIALEKILAEAGMTLADIQQDYKIPATGVLAKLESGELDAAVTYVPTMPYMLASGKVRVLKANLVKNYLRAPIPHSLIISNREFAKRNPQIVRQFLRAIDQGLDYIRRNPTEALYALQRNAKLLGQDPWPLNAVTVEKAGEFVGKINTINLYAETNADLRLETLRNLQAYGIMLHSHGLVDRPVDLTQWLNHVDKENKVTAL